MPLTPIQADVLRVISENRSPESHIAGGIALNHEKHSARFSDDIDIFHDAEEAVMQASDRDVASLEGSGYGVEKRMWTPAFRQVLLSKCGDSLKVEWAQDSAWRFFPIEPDPVLRWKLHPFDALTNKALAMGGRAETRDLVDLVVNSDTYPLHAVIWAACAKDPGFTPLSLLEWMRRNARIQPNVLDELGVRVGAVELKERWLKLADEAEQGINVAADLCVEPGVAFVGPDGAVGWHDEVGVVVRHAQLGGVVPRLGGIRY